MPLGSAAFVALTGIFFAVVGIGSTYDWVSSLPGFTHIRHSGYFLMPAIALSTGMIAVSTGKRRNLHVLLLAINFGFAIWTGSRGPIMIFIVMIALALILFAIMRNIRTVGTIALALGAGTLLSQLVPAPNHSAFNALSRFEGNHAQSADKLSSGRTEIWRDTLRGIAQQPVIGHGGSQFRIQVAAAKKTYNHPHDSILQFAYEWGLVGAAALLALLGLLGQKLLKLAVSNPERHLPLFLATISISMFSLIDGLFYYNLPIMLFLTCAFLMITHAEANAGK